MEEGPLLTHRQPSVTQLVRFFQAMGQGVVEWSAKVDFLPRQPIPRTGTCCSCRNDIRRRTWQPGSGPHGWAHADSPCEHPAVTACQAPAHTHSGRVARWAPANISLRPSPPGSGSPGRAVPRAHWRRKAAAPKGPAPSQGHTVSLDKTNINGKSTATENNTEERRLHRVRVLLGEMRWLRKRRWAWESQRRKPHLPTPAQSLPHRACCWGCPAHPQGCQVTASGTRGSLTLRVGAACLFGKLSMAGTPPPTPETNPLRQQEEERLSLLSPKFCRLIVSHILTQALKFFVQGND